MSRLTTRSATRGFTLIELLVVVAIIAVLAGLIAPALGKAKLKAYYINEINSAKQMMLAQHMYNDDHEGYIFPGYRYDLPASDRDGNPIEHPISARYPWRLAPYLGHHFEILYANKNKTLLHSFAGENENNYTYAASLFPSLGANSVFVGGDDMILSPTLAAFKKFGQFCVLKESDAKRPSQLFAFCSARSKFNERPTEGYYKVDPPFLLGRLWAEDWQKDLKPEAFGFVHPRFGQRTVSAMLDGHAEGLNLTQIQDMRYWANEADRPDWTLRKR